MLVSEYLAGFEAFKFKAFLLGIAPLLLPASLHGKIFMKGLSHTPQLNVKAAICGWTTDYTTVQSLFETS